MKTTIKLSILAVAFAVFGFFAAPNASAHDRDHRRSANVYYSKTYYGHSYRHYSYGGRPVYYRHVRYYPYYTGPRYYTVEHRRVFYRPNIVFSIGF
jgi:hypothetical protein